MNKNRAEIPNLGFDEAITRIAQHTRRKSHYESVKLGMQLLGNMDDEIQNIESIIMEHEQHGYMPDDIKAQWRAMYDKMMEHAKAQLTHDQFIKFYMVF